MMRLQFSHQVTEKRIFGKVTVKQEMVVSADYDRSDDSIDNVEVHLYENGSFVAEISKLLDKAEGNPLATMIEAINWNELYHASTVTAD